VARKELFGGVGLIGFAEFARKVRLHPPFHWEMIAGHTRPEDNNSMQADALWPASRLAALHRQ